ncbi:MAG: DUF5335 family protein [Chloracidobacterium sp.]|nr:DUF5335 family protein [Chloracidobacterium sp.]
MKTATRQHEWTKFLKVFSEQNAGRPTRLGVFERSNDVVNDYWLENGLPLVGIDIDTKKEIPSIQITVGRFTHEVKDAVKLQFYFSLEGDEDGADISCADGNTTILRFETKVA